MDFTQLAVDAGQYINRAIQYTEESIGQASRTELDPDLERLLALADATKTCTDRIISGTEVLLQPNPGARLEDRLYEQLDWSVPPRPRVREALGDEMTQAGLEIGSTTPYGTALLTFGEVQKQLSEEERKFVQSTNIHFLTPLRSFTEGEYRAMQDERRMLLNRRLDLDIAKARLKKAHEAQREDRVSCTDWNLAFEYSFSRMELRICQSLFDRQSEITRQALERISNIHTNHMRSLTDFVEAQASYFDLCNQHAQELQKRLARSVRCSLYSSAANQESDDVSVSNSHNYSISQLSAPNRMVSSHVATNSTNGSAASSQTVVLSATASVSNGTGSAVTSSQPLQPSESVGDSQTTNGVASDTMTTSPVADEPEITNETANEQPTIH
uniref:BAR domain-containing protein n=1 Tax=Echeneis naucrates TaxID=173247 RepID=A0A665WU05_ECHNA